MLKAWTQVGKVRSSLLRINSISYIKRTPVATCQQWRMVTVRGITENSWAADRLEKQGEVLEKEDLPHTVVDEEVLNTPSEKVKKLSEQILSLNILEVHQLMNTIQARLGITPEMLAMSTGMGGGGGGGGGGGSAAPPAAEPEKVKEAFDVKLCVVDAKAKIKIIKEVRTITGLGLKEAKEMVEKAPVVIKEGLKKEDADLIVKALTEAGAEVELI